MADQSTPIYGLASIKLSPGPTADSVRLLLTDTAGKDCEFLLNAEGLKVLLLPALGLATQWADRPDLAVETWAGPQHALPATHVELTKGRNESECALRIFVGKVELAFLVPLDTMMQAAFWLAQHVDPESGRPPH